MKRRYRRTKDNYGRMFGFPVEGPDGHACGAIELIEFDRNGTRLQQRPGLMPPSDAFDMFTDTEGALHLQVNLAKWRRGVTREWEDFAKAVRQEYSRINLECDWSPSGTAGMRGDVRDKVGPDPTPIEFVMAYEQGNRWAIYGEGACPKALQKYVQQSTQKGSVLGSREQIRFDDEGMDEATDDLPAPVVASPRRSILTDLAALDEEFEAKGEGAGVEPVRPRKGAKSAPNAYQTHMKEAMARGLTMADSAKEWRALKDRQKATV
jgi:hypothetical protein